MGDQIREGKGKTTMPAWVRPLFRLLYRSGQQTFDLMGTTAIGLMITLALVVLPAIVTFAGRIKRGGLREGITTLRQLRLRQLRGALTLGGVVTVAIWICVFIVTTAATVYTDHNDFISASQRLREQSADQIAEVSKRDKRIEKLEQDARLLRERPPDVVVKEPDPRCWLASLEGFPNKGNKSLDSPGYPR